MSAIGDAKFERDIPENAIPVYIKHWHYHDTWKLNITGEGVSIHKSAGDLAAFLPAFYEHEAQESLQRARTLKEFTQYDSVSRTLDADIKKFETALASKDTAQIRKCDDFTSPNGGDLKLFYISPTSVAAKQLEENYKNGLPGVRYKTDEEWRCAMQAEPTNDVRPAPTGLAAAVPGAAPGG